MIDGEKEIDSTMEGLIDRAPAIVNGMLLAALVFIAIRPRLMPLIIGGAVLTLLVHFGFRFVSTKLGKTPPQK